MPARISLVVCTRNRAHRLERTLAALERLRCEEPWELILVDNASDDGTPALLSAFRARSRNDVGVVREPLPGLCRARNRACAAACGEIVAFTDDDCYPAPDFLDGLCACFRDDGLGFAGGRVLPHDPTDLPLTLKVTGDRVDYPPGSVLWPGAMHGANMAFRRSVLADIGGFDVLLGAGTPLRSGGDSDALARASAAGFRGAYDPRCVVYHDHGRKTVAAERALYAGYDLGRGGFFAKCLLEPRTRALYRRPIRWHVLRLLGERRFAVLGREARGAATYLWQRLRHALRGRPVAPARG